VTRVGEEGVCIVGGGGNRDIKESIVPVPDKI